MRRSRVQATGGSGQSSECVLQETGRDPARLRSCRIAATSEYYRSIYSTVAGDATRCSSSVQIDNSRPFPVTVEQTGALSRCISFIRYSNGRTPRFSACVQIGAREDIRSGISAGTKIRTAGHAMSCPGSGRARLAAPPRRGALRVLGVVADSPRRARRRFANIVENPDF